ncbi:hypothetical protein D8L93_09135 [Sodalis-like symbiont of Bactericera trigonica]|nr:hypothetical protein D8L93_09135 [Sodalis-like symbiont of Bactericera trigonica]
MPGIVGFFAVGFKPGWLRLGQGTPMDGARGGEGMSPLARRRFFNKMLLLKVAERFARPYNLRHFHRPA